MVNVLLWSTFWALEHLLARKMHVAVQVLQPGLFAEEEELVVDEAILDGVEDVDILHNCLTPMVDKVLDKSISADGNTKSNIAVNHKRCGREQGTEVRKRGISIEHEM